MVTNAGGLTRDGTNAIQAGDLISFKYVLLDLSSGPEVTPSANFSLAIKDGTLRKDGSAGATQGAVDTVSNIANSAVYPSSRRVLLRVGDRLEDLVMFTGIAPTSVFFKCGIATGSTNFSTLPFQLSNPSNGSLSPKITTAGGVVPAGISQAITS